MLISYTQIVCAFPPCFRNLPRQYRNKNNMQINQFEGKLKAQKKISGVNSYIMRCFGIFFNNRVNT